MPLSQFVESYKFWDIVTLWAREKLIYETIVASALAKAIIRQGLKCNSIDTRWGSEKNLEFKGDPYVGFVSRPDDSVIILRSEALEHLLAIVRTAQKPSNTILKQEFIRKNDFKNWLEETGQELPVFWFSM